VLFSKHPPRPNAPPTEGYLFFGHVRIDARTRAMTVTHRDVTGAVLHRTDLAPDA
jgi:alkaline phosphatase D